MTPIAPSAKSMTNTAHLGAEEIAAYLSAALKDGNPHLIAAAIGAFIPIPPPLRFRSAGDQRQWCS